MKILLVVTLLSIFGCSSYRGVNRVGESYLYISGGVLGDKEWSDSLEFTRRSFYKEANLVHDVLITKVEKSSPFFAWFSSLPGSCSPVYILISYTKLGALLSPAFIRGEIESNGFSTLIVPTFSKHIKSNASYQRRNLNFYKVSALCPLKGQDPSQIELKIPGYTTIKVDL
jgi:hypothetical protein